MRSNVVGNGSSGSGSNGSNGARDDRGLRGGLRDILNPVGSASQTMPSASHGGTHSTPGTPGAPAPPRPHSSFSLRSPTQTGNHHASPYSAPTSSAAATSSQQPAGACSMLNNPFVTASTPFPPPPLQAPPSLASSRTSPSGLQHPPRSPLHAPPVYYPSDVRDRDLVRDQQTSLSFYDPTTDSKRDRDRERDRERERTGSDPESGAWSTSTQNSPPKVGMQVQFPSAPASTSTSHINQPKIGPAAPAVLLFPSLCLSPQPSFPSISSTLAIHNQTPPFADVCIALPCLPLPYSPSRATPSKIFEPTPSAIK